jgi:arginase
MTLQRSIRVLGAATGRGAGDVGCQSGPEALRRGGFVSRLAQRGLDVTWDTTLRIAQHGDALPAVRDLSTRLSRRVHGVVARGRTPLVLGGDHSCAIGTWSGAASAVRRRGALGLIWIDAHMDAHLPHTSPSGNLHGMPLACLLGHGEEALVSVAGSPALEPEHVCLVGVRSFESGEAELLARLGVRVIFMDEVRRRGLADAIQEAHAIATHGTAGFGVTFDLDALDPEDAPGVGTPEASGIRQCELLPGLAPLGADRRLVGFEIAEYNPLRDQAGRTAGVVEAVALTVFGAPAVRIAAEGAMRLAA